MTLRVPGAALRLQRRPSRRCPTASASRADLAELLDDPAELAEAVGVFGHVGSHRRHRRTARGRARLGGAPGADELHRQPVP